MTNQCGAGLMSKTIRCEEKQNDGFYKGVSVAGYNDRVNKEIA